MNKVSDAVQELQNAAVTQIINKLITADEIVFKAPTGSGKTYMMADLMNRILSTNKNVVFLVSSLSVSNLAKQNYDSFVNYVDDGKFPELIPYLISTESVGENDVFIEEDKNVYVLPRDLYKKNGKIMQGPFDTWLCNMTQSHGKTLYLIKDECHTETTNLNAVSDFFTKKINFSATPKEKHPDVEITEIEALNANLIKKVHPHDVTENVADDLEKALVEFEATKKKYWQLLKINPCFIIQVSNKNKVDDELKLIHSVLAKHDLTWMYIVTDTKNNSVNGCQTNDGGLQKLPISQWKDAAKENTSVIDVIIFKLTIKEGWNIPRACTLFQMRDVQSTTLNEQVVGRVRRNPKLLGFDDLSLEARTLCMRADVWGVIEPSKKPLRAVTNVSENKLLLKTTKLGDLEKTDDFSLEKIIEESEAPLTNQSIFELSKNLSKAPQDIQKLYQGFVQSTEDWIKFTTNLTEIQKQHEARVCDYAKNMYVPKDADGNDILHALPLFSYYAENDDHGLELIDDWLWKRIDNDDKFAFDSDAEKEWMQILKNLVHKNCVQSETIDGETRYLWGKNFIPNSEINFEYYLDGRHKSYPDFIMKDALGGIHLFEVKSLNQSSKISLNEEEYSQKVAALIKCYTYASVLTGYHFYIPIKDKNSWTIHHMYNGKEESKDRVWFEHFMKSKVAP